MQTHRTAPKRTHLKHAKPSRAGSEQSWTRRYLVVLFSIALFAAIWIGYSKLQGDAVEEDVYVTLQTRTIAGDSQNVVCKLSLLIDPEQENGIDQRRPLLLSVVNSVLAEAYTGARRPTPAEVRALLHEEMNKKLPRKLQVRDVLLQELIIGNS